MVLREGALISGKLRYPSPEPNVRLLTVSELITAAKVLNDTERLVEKLDKLVPIELREDIYLNEPRPIVVLVRSVAARPPPPVMPVN